MIFTPHGKHFIASNLVGSDTKFSSKPAHGPAHNFSVGSPPHIDAAVNAAENAFWSFGYSSRKERAAFLNVIADESASKAVGSLFPNLVANIDFSIISSRFP